MNASPVVCHEVAQQVELARRQAHLSPVEGDPASPNVEDQRPGAQPARDQPMRTQPLRPAQQRLDSRDRLARAERLDQVVVRANLEAEQPVVLVAERADDEDRGSVVVGAPSAKHIEPGQARKHDVEDDHVGAAPLPFGESGRTVRSQMRVEARASKVGKQDRGHGRVVLDDEHRRGHVGSVVPRPLARRCCLAGGRRRKPFVIGAVAPDGAGPHTVEGVNLVDVVLPCLDEADALPWVLRRMPEWARPLVVDNGSTDGSPSIARDLGARVVTVAQRGYGAACHAGLSAASAPLVAVMDCDATLDPQDLRRLLDVHAEHPWRPHLVVGRRVPTSRGAWPWHLRLANRAVARRVNLRTGLRLADVGPMRLAPRQALLELALVDRRSGYPVETVVRAAQAGWRVGQVDVPYAVRVGRSKVTGTPLGVVRAVRDMSTALAQ